MNDLHLADWVMLCIQNLEKRLETMDKGNGPGREISWYIDCIKACRTRIVSLENDAAFKLQARDKIAIQLLPGLLKAARAYGHTDDGEVMGRALQLADLFLEARKEPAIKTIVPVKP